MKISETKIRKIVRRQLQTKKLDKLSKRLVTEAEDVIPADKPEVLGAAGKDYQQKNGEKMPKSKAEAGAYMMKALRSASGITGQEIPALIQFFDDFLEQFKSTNMTASKAKIVGKGIETGKSRAGMRDQ